MLKPLVTLEYGMIKILMMFQLEILMRTGLGMLMTGKVLLVGVFTQVITLSPGRARNRTLSLSPLLRLNILLLVAVAPNFFGCKNSFLIMVFFKSILLSIVTIPVPSISLEILFNTYGPNTLRSNITSFVSCLKMVLSRLSSFTLMTKRLICSPSLQMVDALNSCAKTFVLYPWIDFSVSSSLCICIQFFSSLFVFALFLVFLINKKKGKIRKIQKQCVFVYTSTCVPQMAFETKFPNFISLVAQMSIFMHN